MKHVEAVAGPREVHVEAPRVGLQAIEGVVVDPTKAERGAEVVALARVVVDDVQDHLDAGRVQALHHRLELVDLLAERSGRVAGVGGEEGNGVVAPVVRQASIGQGAFGDELVDRQELHGRDAERAQMLEDRVVDDAQERAADTVGDAGPKHRHPAHMAFVDEGLVPGHARRTVVAPRERVVDDDRLRHRAGAVLWVGHEVLLRAADRVAEGLVRWLDGAADRLRVRVEEELPGVEPVTLLRLVGAVDAEAVELPGPGVGQVRVPDEIGALAERDRFRGDGVARPVEETEVHARRVLGEDREVHASAVPRRPLGIGPTRPRAHAGHAATFFRNTHASGGSVRATDSLRPCERVGAVSSPPRFPHPLPP